YVIEINKSDELEDLAIELGLKEIPSFQIYNYGTLFNNNNYYYYDRTTGKKMSVEAVRLR
ncbi:MAG: hypothetical protein ACKPB9_05225, partial [Dolichospermum sp.]